MVHVFYVNTVMLNFLDKPKMNKSKKEEEAKLQNGTKFIPATLGKDSRIILNKILKR